MPSQLLSTIPTPSRPGALPAVALLLGVAAAPESPRWLARRGAGRGEVLRVLLRLRGVRAAADAADAAAADAADAAAADAADAAAADAAAAAAAVGGGVGAAGIVSSSCSPAAAAAVAAECEEILQGVQQEKGGEETGEGWEREGGSGSGEAEQEGVVESGGVGMRAVGGGKKGAGSKGVWDLSKELLFGHARRPFALCVGLMVLQQCAGINAIVFFAAAIFRNAGFTNPNLPSFGIAAVQVLFTVCSALLLDRAGRRVLLLLSSSGMALSCLLLGLSFYLPHAHLPFLPASSAPLLAFSGCMAYIVFYSMGMGGIPWIIMSEIIPAHMRSLAGSLVVLCNWSLCFLITQTFAVLFAWSSYGTVWLYGTVAAVGVAFIWYCVPETKGRSLEEIEAFFRPENDSYQ
ncbi:unnamed protein product [Closterium sp. NIES-65]|nr:unnamed protein product [Closterium sp. NIES-65]